MITIYLKDVPGASWGISAKIGRDMFFFPGPEPGSPSAGSSEPISFENMGTFDFIAIGLSTGQEFDFFNLELADGEYELSTVTGRLTLKEANITPTIPVATTTPWLPLALVGGGALAVIALARNRRK